jgi:hypothetical protein
MRRSENFNSMKNSGKGSFSLLCFAGWDLSAKDGFCFLRFGEKKKILPPFPFCSF